MRLLVTGGAGFIGSHFTRRAVKSGAWESVTVLDALTYAGNRENLAECDTDSKFTFVHGNITDQDLVATLMPTVDVVVHFAAESHVDRSILNPRLFVETNVLGTQTLVKAALDHGVNKFIHISTDEVYGAVLEGASTESDTLDPRSPYAASKASSDLIALSYHTTYGLDVRVTRCTNNYGPNQFLENIIPLFISNLLRGKKVPLYGAGAQRRQWINVADHCRGIELVIENGIAGEIYNLGSGNEFSNLELTRMLLAGLGKDDSAIEFVADRAGHDFRYSLDYSKAVRDLGYKPAINFAEGLASTIQWYRENTQWWAPLVK